MQLTGKTSTTSTITKQPSPSLLGVGLGLPSTLFYTPYSILNLITKMVTVSKSGDGYPGRIPRMPASSHGRGAN